MTSNREKMESKIVINDVPLTEAQAIVVRVAITVFDASLNEGLGNDEHGRKMVLLYRERIAELYKLMGLT